jgi:hypothetical protein
MSSSSTLGQHAEVVLLPRANHLHRVPCPVADPSPRDCYDQAPGAYACTDETGRRRRAHEFIWETRAGLRCLWCWRIQPSEPSP